MFAYTPLTDKSITYPWEFDSSNDWTSWAGRDEVNTQWRVHTPRSVRAVGEPLNIPFNSFNIDEAAVGHLPNMAQEVQIPSFCKFDMIPVYAAVKTEGAPDMRPYDERIDTNVWDIKHRDLASMLKVVKFDFEPIDLQEYHSVLMELLGQLANLMRGMDAWMETGNSNNVGALTAERLLACLGYSGGLGYGVDVYQSSGDGFTSLIDFVNKHIIGVLRQSYWFWDLIPGTYYHAGLYSKVYLDSNVPGACASSYVFAPRHFYFPVFKHEDSTFRMIKLRMDSQGTFSRDIPYVGGQKWYTNTLFGHASLIARALRFLVNDESYRSIQIALEQLSQKNPKIGDTMQFSYGNFDYYPYVGRPFYFTYDPSMLLAIHNMTIAHGTDASDVEEVVTAGDERNQLVQTFSCYDPIALQTMKMRTMIDLPNKLGPNDWAELMAATQFTIASWDMQPSTQNMLSPKVLGLSVCVNATIRVWTNPYHADSSRTFEIANYVKTAGTGWTAVEDVKNELYKIPYICQFNCFPLVRLLFAFQAPDETWRAAMETMGWLNDLNQVHVLDFNSLQSVKEQLWYNAYGYPINVQKVGSFDGFTQLTTAYNNSLSANIVRLKSGADSSSTTESAFQNRKDERAKKFAQKKEDAKNQSASVEGSESST